MIQHTGIMLSHERRGVPKHLRHILQSNVVRQRDSRSETVNLKSGN